MSKETSATTKVRNPKIRKTGLPSRSCIITYLPADFCDSFVCQSRVNRHTDPAEIMTRFWTDMPRWIDLLFKIRNLLVRPFGLDTGDSNPDPEKLKQALLRGEDYGLMSVKEKNPGELIVSLDDKHLQALLSVYISAPEERAVYLSTVVHYKNRLGVVYFNLIRPFHSIVVRRQFARVMRILRA